MSAVPDIAIGVREGRKGYSMALLILGVLFVAGATLLAYLLSTAPDSVPWAFLVANYIFVLGISQFGVAFSAIMRICRTDWGRPFYRLAEIATLAFFPIAIVLFLLIFAYGKEHLFFWVNPEPGAHLSPWLNADFFLYRNLIAQLVFYGLAAVYFLMGLLPDVTSEMTESGPGWRRSLYKRLWSMRQRRDIARLKTNMFLYSTAVLIVAVIANTFIAWDFGMMLFPHFHSSVYPMFYILGNMIAGTAAVLILGKVTCSTLGLEHFFDKFQLKSVGITLTGFALLWLYMFWAQFFVIWFGRLPNELVPLEAQMNGHYAPYFWAMIFCVFAFPIGTMIFASVKRNWWSLLTVAVVINIGVWLNRYLLVVPALVEDHTPFSSAIELILAAGILAGFLFPFLLLFKAFPMISTWEMRDSAGEEGPAY